MGQMVLLDNELIRINPENKAHIDYSSDLGRRWLVRYAASSAGVFQDLLVVEDKLIALTSYGTYISSTQGRSWIKIS